MELLRNIKNKNMSKNEIENINNVSRISAGTVFKGEIYSQYDMRIDGVFEGKLHSKGRIVVGENAIIKGEIICNNIDLWGKVEGTVHVKDTLVLKSGCHIDGAINVRRFMVELGSEFNGSCRMITEEEYDKMVEKIDAEHSACEAERRKSLEKKPATLGKPEADKKTADAKKSA